MQNLGDATWLCIGMIVGFIAGALLRQNECACQVEPERRAAEPEDCREAWERDPDWWKQT